MLFYTFADALRLKSATLATIRNLFHTLASAAGPFRFSSWTPSVGASGGSASLNSIDWAFYIQIGQLVFFCSRINVTTSSTPSAVTITAPVASFGGGSYYLCATGTDDALLSDNVPAYGFELGGIIYCYGRDSINFSNATGRIYYTGFYRGQSS